MSSDYPYVNTDPNSKYYKQDYRVQEGFDSKGQSGEWHIYPDGKVWVTGGYNNILASAWSPPPNTGGTPGPVAPAAPAAAQPTATASPPAQSNPDSGTTATPSATTESSYPYVNTDPNSKYYQQDYRVVAGFDSNGHSGEWHIYEGHDGDAKVWTRGDFNNVLASQWTPPGGTGGTAAPASTTAVAPVATPSSTPPASTPAPSQSNPDSGASTPSPTTATATSLTPSPTDASNQTVSPGSTDAQGSSGGSSGASTEGSYIVVHGDTLSAIAEQHGLSLSRIEELNPQIKDPNLILPGEKVNLGGGSVGVDTPTPDSGSVGSYTVVHGDTMSGIAQQHGIALSKLEELNPQIKDPDLIFPGQSINLGGGGATTTDTSGGAPVPSAPPVSAPAAVPSTTSTSDSMFPKTSSYQSATGLTSSLPGTNSNDPTSGWAGTSESPTDPAKNIIEAAGKTDINPLKLDRPR